MNEEVFAETVDVALEALGVETGTLLREPKHTLVPSRHAAVSDVLRALRAGEKGSSFTIVSSEPLGVGGMGIVSRARQSRMGREVAVKSVRSEYRSERATLELVQEAWVTGQLEHPNIVPVYDLAFGDDGEPVVLLKRLEGDTWSHLLGDEEALRRRFGVEDSLSFHLQVLAKVCDAVRFAHSRGFVHRDIKPDNVQVGPFGEVYLLDWGIAVSLEDDGTGRLPLSSDSTAVAGTPAYMAPDMLGVFGEPVDQRADIYLLGATLYEVLTGEPPHHGGTWATVARSILSSNPSFPEDAPAGLVALVRRAMNPDRERRLASAEAFRVGLEQFRRHRSAEMLAERAASRQRDLVIAMSTSDADVPVHREAIYRIFGECRFGYRSALEIWPDSEVAGEGLRSATEAMVRYELDGGQAEAARGWLGQLEAPDPELAEKVSGALANDQAKRVRLAELETDIDPSIGRRTRLLLGSLCGGLWVGIPLVGSMAGVRFGAEIGAGSALLFIAFGGGLFFWQRESLLRTRINRNLSLSALAAVVVLLLTSVVSCWGGGGMERAAVDAHLGWTCITAMAAIAVDWRIGVATMAYLMGYLWMSLDPTVDAMLGSAVTNGVLLAVMVGLWTDSS